MQLNTPKTSFAHPLRHGWLVTGQVPGPDVDELSDPEQIRLALREAPGGTLLAAQHPHRTPEAYERGSTLRDTLPQARETLAALVREHYTEVADVVAVYEIDGHDGRAWGALCVVDAEAVGDGSTVRHSEEVYPDVVAERAAALAGLGCATSAALLVPVGDTDLLTPTAMRAAEHVGPPHRENIDPSGRRHRLWLVGPGERQRELLTVLGSRPLLVADGNHRVAATSAAGLSGLFAFVTAGPRLRIHAIHRVLTGTGLSSVELAARWEAAGLTVHEDRDPTPRADSIVALTPERVLRIELPPVPTRDGVPGAACDLLEPLLIDSALGIDPVGGAVHTLPGAEPVTSVPEGADAVLLVAPVSLAHVLAVHEAGERMRRKSTYFTPKPRSGLLLADLDLRMVTEANGGHSPSESAVDI